LYQRHISMIQSKGRARAPGSHYLLFCEKGVDADAPFPSTPLLTLLLRTGNVAEKRKLVQISRFDEDMFSLFDRSVGEEEEEAADELDFFGAANERCTYYTEPSTGATITPHSALSLLQR
jgi:hypothetical protein